MGYSLGTLSKLRWRRQRGHGKTEDLIGRAIAQHARFKMNMKNKLKNTKNCFIIVNFLTTIPIGLWTTYGLHDHKNWTEAREY